MFAQYVHHRQRDLVSGTDRSPASSPIAARHPLFKLVLALGTLSAFLLVPDRTAGAVAGKLAVLGAIFFLSGGIGRAGSLLRGGLALFGFLAVLLICALLGDLLSGGDSLHFFFALAGKSFWTLAVSLLLFETIRYTECVYLSRLLRVPPRLAVQILLVILIGRKIAREFSRVPAAWKSRGLSARCLRRHPARTADLLTVVLLRAVDQGVRLETALLGRGFSGRLYTCFSARWGRADSAALGGFCLIVLLLLNFSYGSEAFPNFR